ncbi:MAG: efflux transporter outer membrane subunit [Gammaproteobacteria bacterium]|nr:MAG: efflux transporter outer membrane subunit [Gammaproteobacteria bacterium]
MKANSAPAGVVLAAAAMLSGCALAPPLKLPAVPTAAAYKEAGPWIPAQPADGLSRGDWWKLYGDPDLNALQMRLIEHSPDLAAALSRYDQAKAVSDQMRSGLFPSLALGADTERDGLSNMRPLRPANSANNYNSFTVGVQANYELDLWGRIRNEVTAARAEAQAYQADLESARLSLQAQLADDYIVLRGLDQQIALLNETVSAYEKALALTEARHAGGIAAGLDVARAQTQLDTSRSLAEQTLALRAVSEHAIAALTGASASEFSIAPRVTPLTLPQVPVGVPSTLVQRRPDIAAAERRIAASNANVGVARAAFFPAVTLSAALGYQSTQAGNWITAPNTFWSIGPSLLFSLFDAGKRKAQVAQAQAALDESGSLYRAVVLTAFQQVEDSLALTHHYRIAATEEHAAVTAAQRSLDLSLTQYREGATSYLDVVTSQTVTLQSELTALDLDTRELRASVQLIRALGGGWTPAQMPVS